MCERQGYFTAESSLSSWSPDCPAELELPLCRAQLPCLGTSDQAHKTPVYISFMGFISGQWDPELQGKFKILMAEGHHLGEKGFLLPAD